MPVKWNNNLPPKVNQAIYRGVVKATNLVRNNIITLIRTSEPSGRTYGTSKINKSTGKPIRSGKRAIHIASAPGEPPAVDTGVYIRLITAVYDKPTLTGRVVSSGKQAAWLEYGTARMEARPHMRPGLNMSRKGIQEAIVSSLKAALYP